MKPIAMRHPYGNHIEWHQAYEIRQQLTEYEKAAWRDLNCVRTELRYEAEAADKADPLKQMLLNRKPTAQMRQRRAALMGCADWLRGPSGQLQGQLLLKLGA